MKYSFVTVLAINNILGDPPAQLVEIRHDAFGAMGDLGDEFPINS